MVRITTHHLYTCIYGGMDDNKRMYCPMVPIQMHNMNCLKFLLNGIKQWNQIMGTIKIYLFLILCAEGFALVIGPKKNDQLFLQNKPLTKIKLTQLCSNGVLGWLSLLPCMTLLCSH